MRDDVDAALRRYEAMDGVLRNTPEAVVRQGEADRRRFGDRYIRRNSEGRSVWDPVMVIRFLVEACGIPLAESRDAVIDNAGHTGVAIKAGKQSPIEQAKELLAACGNVIEARELVAVFCELPDEGDPLARPYWRAVLESIETKPLVPEDTGVANWD